MSVSDGVGFREVDGPVEDQHLSVVDRLEDLDVLEQRLDIQNDLLDAVLYDPIIWNKNFNYSFQVILRSKQKILTLMRV